MRAIRNFRVHLYMIMIRAARLGVWERQWLLEATPPRLDPQFQEIRECLRPVQQVVQAVRQEMAVGRKQRAMGSQALRRIFTLIGTAVALIPGGTSSGSTPFFDLPQSGAAQDDHQTFFGFELRADYQDETLPGPGDRPLHADHRARGHGPRGDRSGGPATSSAPPRCTRPLDVYKALPTTSARPPPAVDILEIFAGEAKPSARASRFGLNACQPLDLSFGWDLQQPDQQRVVMDIVRRLRPWAIIIGYPSK